MFGLLICLFVFVLGHGNFILVFIISVGVLNSLAKDVGVSLAHGKANELDTRNESLCKEMSNVKLETFREIPSTREVPRTHEVNRTMLSDSEYGTECARPLIRIITVRFCRRSVIRGSCWRMKVHIPLHSRRAHTH